MNATINDKKLNEIASTLISNHGSLHGLNFDNIKDTIKDILNGDINSLISLLDDANQTGYSKGYDCAVSEMEENS